MKLTTDKKARKEQPITRGVLDYFPNAIAEVARVSFIGNQQHNPGENMHWARGKSQDHADCISRHLIERGTLDDDGLRHTAKVAWRALALLQLELEAAQPNACGPAQTDTERVAAAKDGEWVCVSPDFLKSQSGEVTFSQYRRQNITTALLTYGCPPAVAECIANGMSFCPRKNTTGIIPTVYIAGPMRGYKDFNFPAFDAAGKHFLTQGFDVISPADIDRAAGDVTGKSEKELPAQHVFVFRDFWAIYFLALWGHGHIAMLPGWEKSRGATAEHALAHWLGLNVLYV